MFIPIVFKVEESIYMLLKYSAVKDISSFKTGNNFCKTMTPSYKNQT